MKIYALNDMQSHIDSVKKMVSLVGSVVLRGYETYGIIQLLEGSHRMAHAIALGLPVTIVLLGKDEVTYTIVLMLRRTEHIYLLPKL